MVILTYGGLIFFKTTGFFIYFLSISIGLLIGMEIPLAIRLNNDYQTLRVNISSILEKDYYGSLLGGVFFAFIGLPYLGLVYTPFVLGGINFLVSLGLIWMISSQVGRRNKVMWGSLSLILFGVLLVGLKYSQDIIEFGESTRYKDIVVEMKQSRYQRIVLTE